MRLFLKNLLFTVLVPGSVAFWVPLAWASRTGHMLAPPASVLQALALLPIVTGALIYLWCVWDFGVQGRGTPAPVDAPKVLVIRGLYRYVRNPMYVGVSTVVAGWALWFRMTDLLWYGVTFLVLAHCFVVFYEEPTLRRLFGSSYDEYCRRVGRWVPKRLKAES